jgi:hypothetical protein
MGRSAKPWLLRAADLRQAQWIPTGFGAQIQELGEAFQI